MDQTCLESKTPTRLVGDDEYRKRYGDLPYRVLADERAKYAGNIVHVGGWYHGVCRGFDDWWEGYYRDMVVWNPQQGSGHTVRLCDQHQDSIIAPDATPKVCKLYHDWFRTVWVPERTRLLANQVRNLELQRLRFEVEGIERPTVQRGQLWVVMRGRKVPHGTSGKVFWSGTTGAFSTFKVGLSASGVRDANNRYTDAVFVAHNNCDYIPTDEELQRIENIRREIAGFDQTRLPAIRKEIEDRLVANPYAI